MNESDLEAKGYRKNPDGSWTKRPLRDLAGLGIAKREPDPSQALDRRPSVRQGSKGGMAIRVEIVSFRKRLLDSDNLIGGLKHARDAIARSLGIDDGDPRISWNYSQLKTTTQPGTLVKILITQHENLRTNL